MERITPPIFTHWLKNAQRTYPFLNDLTHDQEQLRSDVNEAFEHALAAAAEKPAAKPPGYTYSFICGFVEGFLNSRWHFEYVVRARVMDSTFCTIMAMWELFKERPDLEEPLGALFRKYTNDFNTHECTTGRKPLETAPTPYLDRAVAYLDEALDHHFRPMRESKCEEFCPDMDRFLKQEDVKPFLSHQGRDGETGLNTCVPRAGTQNI